MNELTRNITRVGRHKALLCMVLLLTLAALADRFSLQDNRASVVSSEVLVAGLPSPDEDPGNRAGTSWPCDHGEAAQLIQFVLQSDNSPERTKIHNRSGGRSILKTNLNNQLSALGTTVSMINSRLGRQFTLVGARPSGTS